MRVRRFMASGLALALLAAAGIGLAADGLSDGLVEFATFKVTRLRFAAPAAPPAWDEPASKFFRASFGLRAKLTLADDSDGVDLATDPIYLSFGRFTAYVGADRIVTSEGNVTELRYSARGLNHVRRFFLRHTPTGIWLRVRATRLNAERPDRVTLQIGEDVGQVDTRTLQLVEPIARLQGLVVAGLPQSGVHGARVDVACPAGACRGTTDEMGRFSLAADTGDHSLTVRGAAGTQDALARISRRARVRAGTTDVGLLMLTRPGGSAGALVADGNQTRAVTVRAAAGDPPAALTIRAGANVAFPDAGNVRRRVTVSYVPSPQLPVAPPSGLAAARTWTAEPAGASVSPCADLLLDNPVDGLADGARVGIYALDADTGTWTHAADGVVVDHGAHVRADAALCELTSFFIACEAEITSVRAQVAFRGAEIARVPVFLHGRTAMSSASGHDAPNLSLQSVSAGCIGKTNTLRAYAALPLADGGYLAGVSNEALTIPGGETDLGQIVLTPCGDGVVEGSEECDGADVGGRDCRDLGYDNGDLACTATCALDLGGCRSCGDGVRDPGEECDAQDDALCTGACRGDCSCPPVCGDGARNQASEECDGSDDALCAGGCDDACRCPIPATPTTTLPADECPLGFDFIPRGRARSLSGATEFSVGFTGLGHDRDVPGGHPLRVAVECGGSAGACGECSIVGLAPVRGRCANDASRVCDTVGGADPEQCGGNRCDVFFTPPLHNMWGGGPSCFLERLTRDVAGTFDDESGSATLSVDLAGDLYIGISPTQPCPVCVDDDLANDGFRDGRCAGGESDGLPCDANGDDPTFGSTSFDCLPGAGLLGAPIPLTRSLDLRNHDVSLGFDTPCDFPMSASACACAVCEDRPQTACRNDDDCTAAGATGPCSARGSGALRKPNVCDGGSCVDTGDGIHGRCQTTPSDTFCDGTLFAHGTPYLGCLSNNDCAAIDEACGGDCGECTIAKPRSCFLDPIVGEQYASPNRVVLSDVICLAPGVSPALDQVAGLAGPERVTVEFDVRRILDPELLTGDLPRGRRRSR